MQFETISESKGIVTLEENSTGFEAVLKVVKAYLFVSELLP